MIQQFFLLFVGHFGYLHLMLHFTDVLLLAVKYTILCFLLMFFCVFCGLGFVQCKILGSVQDPFLFVNFKFLIFVLQLRHLFFRF